LNPNDSVQTGFTGRKETMAEPPIAHDQRDHHQQQQEQQEQHDQQTLIPNPNQVHDGDYVALLTTDSQWSFGRAGKKQQMKIGGRKYDTIRLVGCEYGSVFLLNRKSGLQLVEEKTVFRTETELLAILGLDRDQEEEEEEEEEGEGEREGEREGEDDDREEHDGNASEDEQDYNGNDKESKQPARKRQRKLVVKSLEEETRTNRLLNDDQRGHQQVSCEEIRDMIDRGVPGTEILSRIVKGSVTFDAKTQYSQLKYLLRKQRKFLVHVRLYRPTASILCKVYFQRNPHNILSMRVDALALLLTMANIRANTQVMIIDHALGLVVAAIAERMQGCGRILNMFTGHTPSQVEMAKFLNLSNENMDVIKHVPIHFLPMVDKPDDPNDDDSLPVSYAIPSLISSGITAQELMETSEGALRTKRTRNESDAQRDDMGDASPQGKDITPSERKSLMTRPTRRDLKHWIRAGCDSLVVVVKHDSIPVVDVLLKYLIPSGTLTVFSPSIQPLAELHYALCQTQLVTRVQLNETSLLNHQVLQGRTHPFMTDIATGGFVLTAVKLDTSR